MDSMISMEQFEALNGAMNEAQKDDTPYVGTIDDQMHVFGNPNKTEIKSADYAVSFVFPDEEKWRKRIERNGDRVIKKIDRYIAVERTYKNVYLSPRNVGSAITALTLIAQFMSEVLDNGEVKPLNYEELLAVFQTMNHEISDAAYELVIATLKIPYDEADFIAPINAMEVAIQIVANNPSAVNEADLFFGLSPAKA